MHCQLFKDNYYYDDSWLRFKCMWGDPPLNTSMDFNEIHVWRIFLDQEFKAVKALEQLLDENERLKAFRFHYESDKLRYIVRHGILKNILSKYLCFNPEKIQFKYTSFGKPFLSSSINKASYHFNITHSKRYALLAVTRNRSIGIDLEYMLPIINMDSMIKSFLSGEEYKIMSMLSPEDRFQRFYDLWTLKEAYLKATGAGLNKIGDVGISFSMDHSAVSIIERENENKSNNFTIFQLDPAPGYTAGLAIEGKERYSINFYDYTGE